MGVGKILLSGSRSATFKLVVALQCRCKAHLLDPLLGVFHRRALTTMPQDADLKIPLGKIIHLQNKIWGRDPFEKIMNAPNAGGVETLR